MKSHFLIAEPMIFLNKEISQTCTITGLIKKSLGFHHPMTDELCLGHGHVTPPGGNSARLCLFMENLKEGQDHRDAQGFTKRKIK